MSMLKLRYSRATVLVAMAAAVVWSFDSAVLLVHFGLIHVH